MSNENNEHFNLNETCQAPLRGVFQATASDYRSFRDNIQNRVDQDSSNLVNKGMLTDLQLDMSSETQPERNNYLKGHISNVPEVSQGIQNIDDAETLGTGVAAGLRFFATQTLTYLATPYAVRDTILQLGPILDTSVNYYANTSVDHVSHDAQSAAVSIGDAVNQTLSYPLKPEQRGAMAGVLMPLFVSDGITVPTAQKVEQVSSKELAESELSEIRKILQRAGKGGDWPVLNESAAADCVLQFRGDACVAAVGEMLSDGRLNQVELFEKVRTIPELLAKELGPEWRCSFVADSESALNELLRRGKSWGVELKDEFRRQVSMGHMVVVDGLDEAGNVMIRDSQHATRYEMTREDFIKHWTGRAVYR